MITQLSPKHFEVDGHSVRFVTKKGRTLMICDCCNDTKFCNESPICSHKSKVFHYIFTEPARKKIQELVEFYKIQNKLKEGVTAFMVYDDFIKILQLIEKTEI